MTKIAVLAEKPSVARDLARVLGCQRKGNGYLEGSKYIVTWALGHLVTLAEPEVYDDKYKAWRLDDLPMLPDPLKLVVIKQTSKQYQAVREVLQRKDVSEIVIATDAGREGELVARWIIEKAKINKRVKRLWISSVTDKAIRDGFAKLKDGKEYLKLFDSAVARSEADWLVGINATRALTTRYNAQLSCGRVQTPTLAIVMHREQEIRNFQPQAWYAIQAQASKANSDFNLQWQEQKTNSNRTFDKQFADQIIAKINKQADLQANVIDVKKAAKKQYAPQLYDLTELQRDANNRYGYSAKETLNIMQKLYEQHKYLTYPRTDSRYISNDIVSTLKDRVKAVAVNEYQKFCAQISKSTLKAGKHFVDDAKVSDHHAIIPTEEAVFLNKLSDQERKIWELVVKRFLAVLLAPHEYEQTTITATLAAEKFTASGKIVIQKGWKALYERDHDSDEDADAEQNQTLPALNKGDKLTITSVTSKQGYTKAPPYLTEGTLLTAMESPAKYMDNKDGKLKQTLTETGGLGTVATRADIIDKLFNSFLLELRAKEVHITSKGKQLLQLVPNELKSPELTANWEQKLQAIAQGKLDKNKFVAEMRSYAKKVVMEIKQSDSTFKHDNLTRSKCPECGKYMLEVQGKKGKMLVCEDRECGKRQSVSRVTNARCPECRKKLELRGQGEGQIFVCKCGHREKLSVFEKRREQQGVGAGKVSKQEAKNIMNKLNKQEEPVNTALADALAKLKL